MNREIKNALFTSLVLVLAVIILYILYLVKGVIPTILFGSVVAYILLPITNFFHKLKLPRSLASFLSIILFFLLIVILGYFLLPFIIRELAELARKLPNLQKNIASFFEGISKIINSGKDTYFINTMLLNLISNLQGTISNILSSIPNKITGAFGNVASFIFSFLLAYFFMKDSPAIYRIVLRRFYPKERI